MKFGGVEEELGGYGLHGHLLVRVGHVGEPFNKRRFYFELYIYGNTSHTRRGETK